jgi:chromosome segregation ATPase
MDRNEEFAVRIGIREIYDQQTELVRSINKLDSRLERIEEKLQTMSEVEERSQKAYEIAKDAFERADHAKEIADKALGRIDDEEKERRMLIQKYKVAIVGALVPYFLFGLGFLIYLIKVGF